MPVVTDTINIFTFSPVYAMQIGTYVYTLTLIDGNGGVSNFNFHLNVHDKPRFSFQLKKELKIRIS